MMYSLVHIMYLSSYYVLEFLSYESTVSSCKYVTQPPRDKILNQLADYTNEVRSHLTIILNIILPILQDQFSINTM